MVERKVFIVASRRVQPEALERVQSVQQISKLNVDGRLDLVGGWGQPREKEQERGLREKDKRKTKSQERAEPKPAGL